jgi:hypothetical protein
MLLVTLFTNEFCLELVKTHIALTEIFIFTLFNRQRGICFEEIQYIGQEPICSR